MCDFTATFFSAAQSPQEGWQVKDKKWLRWQSRPSPSSSVSASFLLPSAANCATVLCHSKSHFCPSRPCRLHWQSEGGEEGSHGRGGGGRGRRKEPTEAFFSPRCTYLFILGSAVEIWGRTGRNWWSHSAVEVVTAGNLLAQEEKRGLTTAHSWFRWQDRQSEFISSVSFGLGRERKEWFRQTGPRVCVSDNWEMKAFNSLIVNFLSI